MRVSRQNKPQHWTALNPETVIRQIRKIGFAYNRKDIKEPNRREKRRKPYQDEADLETQGNEKTLY